VPFSKGCINPNILNEAVAYLAFRLLLRMGASAKYLLRLLTALAGIINHEKAPLATPAGLHVNGLQNGKVN
jgi:hypothetical protein